MNKKIIYIQTLTTFFILFIFYYSFKVIFESIDKYNVSVIKKQMLFSLSDDIAEGNLFKLGYIFSKLNRENVISSGAIIEIKDKERNTIYQTPNNEQFYEYYNGFDCKLIKDEDIIKKMKKQGTLLITVLPYNFSEEKCRV